MSRKGEVTWTRYKIGLKMEEITKIGWSKIRECSVCWIAYSYYMVDM